MTSTAMFQAMDLGVTYQETISRFDQLQEKLVPLWELIRSSSDEPQTIVVVPSQSMEFDVKGAEMQAYEERFLFLLFLLRQPNLRVIYTTSQSVLPSTIDYYLGLVPDVTPEDARRRLHLIAPEDRSDRPLSAKLLERPGLIRQIRSLIPDRNMAHLIPYNTTYLERDLALLLGIPMYASDPEFSRYGTKSGGRQLFAEIGVRHPLGHKNLRSIQEVSEAISEMRRQMPDLRQLMLKLNEGVSGEGNAVIDVTALPEPGTRGERDALRDRIETMQLECPGTTHEAFFSSLATFGGVVEERITGDEIRSPSVQLRITPLGEVELLSTHDQLLGGKTGQSYLGCQFPADPGYARIISRESMKVAERLVKEGVVGRFAVDFLAVRCGGDCWATYAIELNLRKGGTTHPFLTLQFLAGGSYDPDRGVFETPEGRAKHYVASDHLESPLFRVLTPQDLFAIVARHGLEFDSVRQTGAVFHMIATLAENGRIGVTAVGDSKREAERLFERIQSILEEEANRAARPLTLPAA